MGKVIYVVSMSLDGYITGANVRPEAGLGEGGDVLHTWAMSGNFDAPTQEIMDEYSRVGASIVGRVTYDLSIQYWGADGPTGPARIPTIIVSHSVPQDIPGDGVYTFVNGVEAAFETAKNLAGDKDISTTGADVAQQLLKLGLIDEISIHLVPVLFGSGTRLFEGLDGEHISLEIIETIQTAQAVHMRFRVLK
jgi:dihydrofolate reductase